MLQFTATKILILLSAILGKEITYIELDNNPILGKDLSNSKISMYYNTVKSGEDYLKSRKVIIVLQLLWTKKEAYFQASFFVLYTIYNEIRFTKLSKISFSGNCLFLFSLIKITYLSLS